MRMSVIFRLASRLALKDLRRGTKGI
jgi:hypothetical protein